MTQDLIVADTGPLIGLAVAGRLDILHALFEQVLIPEAVLAELELDTKRPGALALSSANDEGWLRLEKVPESTDVTTLTELLDRGEAEAIVLAQSREAKLLIDERKGRTIARHRGVSVIGTGGILLLAKREGALDQIAPVLDELAANGYRSSDALRRELLNLAGES